MNRRTCICLLAAVLAACGQPPPPTSPRPEPPAGVTTTTTSQPTTTTTVAPSPTTTTTTQPKPPPRTTTTKPPPPPPKPPNRLVITSELRGSLEEQTGIPFSQSWSQISGQIAEICPGGVLCVGYARVVDASTGSEDDCEVVKGGISVPDPLLVGGKITFRVTNDRCPEV